MKTIKHLLVVCATSAIFCVALPVQAVENSPEASAVSIEGEDLDLSGSGTYAQPSINQRPGSEHFLTVITPEDEVVTGGIDTLALQAGETYKVRAAYRNDGKTNAVESYIYAQGTKIKCDLPEFIDGDGMLAVTFVADNTVPLEVGCVLSLHADEPLRISYEPSSAVIVNQNPTNGQLVDSQTMFGHGALIGSNSMSGIVLPGDEYAGVIEFTFTTYKTDKVPATVQVTEKPQPPHDYNSTNRTREKRVIALCVLGIIAVIAIVSGAVGYYIYWQKQYDEE